LDISGSNVLLFLDTSGDHLGKRGYRLAPGPAPLAENRAAALIRKLARIQPDPQWILDGMTGSGTFAFESSLFFQGLSVGGGRDFAFSQWPSYRESTKNYWSRQRIEPNVRVGQNEKVKVIANDRDDRSLGAAKMNLDQFRSRFCTGGREPRFVKGDFFSLSSKADEFIGPGWVFLNPPYDYRISGSLDQFANKLTRWIETSGLEGTLVLLLPQNRIVEKFSSIPRVFDDLVFNHGGRGVNLLGLSLK